MALWTKCSTVQWYKYVHMYPETEQKKCISCCMLAATVTLRDTLANPVKTKRYKVHIWPGWQILHSWDNYMAAPIPNYLSATTGKKKKECSGSFRIEVERLAGCFNDFSTSVLHLCIVVLSKKLRSIRDD